MEVRKKCFLSGFEALRPKGSWGRSQDPPWHPKVTIWGTIGTVLGSNWDQNGTNMAPKTDSKSMVFGVQEPTYVARAEIVKICTTLKRKPVFWRPGVSQNRTKIDGKSILRAFYVEVLFENPLETLPEPSWARLGRDLWNFGAQVGSQVGACLLYTSDAADE